MTTKFVAVRLILISLPMSIEVSAVKLCSLIQVAFCCLYMLSSIHLCFNITEKDKGEYRTDTTGFKNTPENMVKTMFSNENSKKSDSILSSYRFKLLCNKLNLLRISKVANNRLLKKSVLVIQCITPWLIKAVHNQKGLI